ncbi:MAG: ATP-binding cassette domain-containing protein [Candidatus Brocadia sp. AMX2]|uniref:ABC transporter ATP-binding protein n=1 Tax=Candidatus Brocadia sinica JPN1 TaxID=1197129 RepID=A0ABQ0JZQ1_9BACT|nr:MULTISPECIES: ATP-binding cassette domain-containing protein [Brocadia]KXK32161.1 MAG: cobalt ABC transporter ATP-binding component [Candidatus Brocadia sinica]MBC6931484.1 ATP-binding cassette domain-containing protein [Candidatus Brocadia sp.]MBL1169129.1 ATP-binding cassette domain-containing protein [Candidatus Brocadia sp. AMX1]NOG42018.1 ATP-binding cassette domain-containing protein [Planctomycetota bacterium]KAA0244916.1 MAG: ATP-binding cassette domain-containing protein [Candidatu
MVILQINNVQYRYHDGTHALHGVCLDILKGEFLAILGPNGSGKTTLLKHLNGLLKPMGGELLLEQKPLAQYTSKEIFQRVGIVFQDPNDQLFAPSVWEDVAFGPMNLGLSKNEIAHRVDEALSLVGMKPYARKTVDALSFGQRKRVCIAGVLAMRPEVLVLDEPTCGLDPVGVTSLMVLLRELNNKYGITVIMATNSVDLVPVYMDRLAIMYHGDILRAGTPEDIFSNAMEIKHACLELPQIAQLMQLLRDEDNLPMDALPLTVGEARKFLISRLNGMHFLAKNHV